MAQIFRQPAALPALPGDLGRPSGAEPAAPRAPFGLGFGGTLRLPSDQFLAKQITLSARAGRALQRVAAMKIETSTPFDPSEVYWTLQNRRRSNGQISATLVMLRKDLVAQAARGRKLRRVVSDDGAYVVTLPRRQSRLLQFALPLLLIVAAAVPVGLAFQSQERELQALEAQLQRARAQAQEAGDAAVGAVWEAHRSELARLGEPVEILAEVTRLVPDDAYLERLSLRDGTLQLSGRAAQVTTVAEALSRSAKLTGLRLEEQRFEIGTDKQRFAITAQIAPITGETGQ